MASALLSTSASAQSQGDLDGIAKTCGLPTERLVLKNDHVLLLASPDDSFIVMGCVRTQLDKIPGANDKFGVVMWDKKKAKAN
jgi:hypothetical protein